MTIDLEDTRAVFVGADSQSRSHFFDIHTARLTPEVAKAEHSRRRRAVDRGARGAESAGIVRVVLDVNGVKDYTASLQDNPPELIIDLYPNSGADANGEGEELR